MNSSKKKIHPAWVGSVRKLRAKGWSVIDILAVIPQLTREDVKSIIDPHYQTPEQRKERQRILHKIWLRQDEINKMRELGFCNHCLEKVYGHA